MDLRVELVEKEFINEKKETIKYKMVRYYVIHDDKSNTTISEEPLPAKVRYVFSYLNKCIIKEK